VNLSLEPIVTLLPVSWQPRAKGIVAAAGSAVGLATLVVNGTPDWLTKAVLVATALGVYAAPNVGYTREAAAPPVTPKRRAAMDPPE
jgi:hypothetical protein